MDQNKTGLLDEFDVRIVGGIAHTEVKQVFSFLVTQYSKETNTMVECLRRILDAQASLPDTLVLQLDNTSQENKNTRLFGFLGQLVDKGVFKHIIVNFLVRAPTRTTRFAWSRVAPCTDPDVPLCISDVCCVCFGLLTAKPKGHTHEVRLSLSVVECVLSLTVFFCT